MPSCKDIQLYFAFYFSLLSFFFFLFSFSFYFFFFSFFLSFLLSYFYHMDYTGNNQLCCQLQLNISTYQNSIIACENQIFGQHHQNNFSKLTVRVTSYCSQQMSRPPQNNNTKQMDHALAHNNLDCCGKRQSQNNTRYSVLFNIFSCFYYYFWGFAFRSKRSIANIIFYTSFLNVFSIFSLLINPGNA